MGNPGRANTGIVPKNREDMICIKILQGNRQTA